MENKITRKRLAHFLSYEWFAIAALVVVSIFLLNMIYSFAAVRLTTGQVFTFYYDKNIDSRNVKNVWGLINSEKDGKQIFSYDIIDVEVVDVPSDHNILTSYLQNGEGDMIITDVFYNAEKKMRRMCEVVDGGHMYSYDSLILDAKTYLIQFLKDEVKGVLLPEGTELTFSTVYPLEIYDFDAQYDLEKIRAVFLERMKGDNRFRSEEQKQAGYQLEVKRIQNLVRDAAVLDRIMKLDDQNSASENYQEESYFYHYTTHAQKVETATNERDKEKFQGWFNSQKEYNLTHFGKEKLRYGLKLEKLSGEGKEAVGEYFRRVGSKTEDIGAKDVVMMPVAFPEKQPHLQYETLTFFAKVVRNFSNLAD